MNYNILEAYKQQQKEKKKKRTKKRLNCLDCVHGYDIDSSGFKVIDKRAFCGYFDSVVQVGCANNCPWFVKKEVKK